MARWCAVGCLVIFGASLVPPVFGYDLNRSPVAAPADLDALVPTADEPSPAPQGVIAGGYSGRLFAAQ